MNETILSLFSKAKERNERNFAIRHKEGRIWKGFSWIEYYQKVKNISNQLNELGIKKTDKVVIVSNSRYEWVVSDLAIMSCGAITVPIYKNSQPEDIEYIINHCEAKAIFCEDKSTLEVLNSINIGTVKNIIVFDEIDSQKNISFTKMVSTPSERSNSDFDKALNSVSQSDLATIIYTSGTTGLPKGVLHTHKQIYNEVLGTFGIFDLSEKDSTLSFLPAAHVMGRIEILGNIYKPFTLAFAEKIEKIKSNIIEVKPTIIIAVPRIFEKIHTGILNSVSTKKTQLKVFNWAVSIGIKVSKLKMKNKKVPMSLAVKYQLATKLIFKKVHTALGGRLRIAISGGAPLNQEIAHFFHAAGVLILEGYGLTETMAAVTLNTEGSYKFSTVGKPICDAEIKIEKDGEILIKSSTVMEGYFKNEEETKNSFDSEGFFKTGDIGEFDSDGFLRITDRKKDLIKTAGGKYVAPQKLENLAKNIPEISNIVVHGDRRKFIVALVTLEQEQILIHAKNEGISYSNYEELIKNSEIIKYINSKIAELNSNLARYETIKKFKILPKEFTIESGELTPSLKVKRKFCDEKYSEEIETLYSN